MQIEGDWSDLNGSGFVVVRGFLSPEAVATVLKPYLAAMEGDKYLFVPAAFLGPGGLEVLADLQGRFRELFPAIEKRAGLHLTTFDPFTTYFPNRWYDDDTGKPLDAAGWHSDPPPYHLFQDVSQYVNCWIPLIKPKADESGLTLLPMDRLREKDPTFYEAIQRRGGAAFASSKTPPGSPGSVFPLLKVKEAGDYLTIDRDGEILLLEPRVDIDDIGVTPDVMPGDAIFAHGDVLHRAQDQKANRVAISLRGVNGEMKVTKDFLLRLPELWRRSLANPGHHFAASFLGAFAYHGRDTLTVQEALDFITAVFMQSPEQFAATEAVRAEMFRILGVTSIGPLV